MKPARVGLMLFLGLVTLVVMKSERVSACPVGWTTPSVIDSGAAGKSCVLAFSDRGEQWQHVFWHDSSDSAIRTASRRYVDGYWGEWGNPVTVAHTTMSMFGAAIDSLGDLHVVWANASEIGPWGETSNLYYKTWSSSYKTETIYNITPTYNVPGDEDPLSQDFDGGSLPEGWGTEGEWNALQHVPPTGPWGQWTVANDLGQDSSYCAVGKRLEEPQSSHWYLVMPPLLVSEGDSAEFSFWYRLDREDTVGLAVRGLEGFRMGGHRDFTEAHPSRRFVLWEALLTSTEFDTVKIGLADSLEGKFLHVAFDLYSASNTTVRVCIDNVCTSVADALRPRIPTQPAACAAPVVAADNAANVHVAFERVSWQPDACVSSSQMYYLRYDASLDSLAWCTPVHVDSSGVGDRDYCKPYVYRKSCPSLPVKREMV